MAGKVLSTTEALLGLNMLPAIGARRLSRILETFSYPGEIFSAKEEDLERCGLSEGIIAQIKNFDLSLIKKERETIEKLKIRIVTIYDNDYPALLKQIPSAPLVLYVKGMLPQCWERALAIVGTRYPSLYGISCAQYFAAELSQRNFIIISGLARGIDAAAHRGALRGAGVTVAVLGSGLAHIYPAENISLAEEISRQGALISEFPLSTGPRRENFPRRNRIISGLSRATLVIEAGINSGALITANFALEQGRDVYSIPGSIYAPTTTGTHQLLKEGAKLVTDVDDILEEFNLEDSLKVAARKELKNDN